MLYEQLIFYFRQHYFISSPSLSSPLQNTDIKQIICPNLGIYSSEHDHFYCRAEKNRQGEAIVSPHTIQPWCNPRLRMATGESSHSSVKFTSTEAGRTTETSALCCYVYAQPQPTKTQKHSKKKVNRKKNLFRLLEKFRLIAQIKVTEAQRN